MLLSSADGETDVLSVWSAVPAARNISSAVVALLARKLVAAARPSSALQDTVPRHGLQHRLKMPFWQSEAHC
jgi:hypothetical protein